MTTQHKPVSSYKMLGRRDAKAEAACPPDGTGGAFK
jgi:hypothetical protein